MQILIDKVSWLLRVVANAGYKFYWDDCFSRASSLAYTTLFSLVPMTALTFAVFKGFEIDEKQLEIIFENMLPSSDFVKSGSGLEPGAAIDSAIAAAQGQEPLLDKFKTQIFEQLRELGRSVRELSMVGLAIVATSGILLLNTIESAFNVVWRASAEVSVISKVMNYWAVITGGPLLIAWSFYWYTRFGSLSEPDTVFSQMSPVIDLLVPVLVIWIALMAMYNKMPATNVSLRDSALGAFFAAILFEVIKRAFAYYISHSTTYQSFYGVLVTIPLFLFWLYILWIVVLFGAEITYQAGSIDVLSGLRKYKSELGEIGAILGLRILHTIGCRFVEGVEPPTESDIALETGSDPVLVRTSLELLTDAGLISAGDPKSHRRSLAVSPNKISLGSIVNAFHSKHHLRSKESAEEAGLDEVSFLETLRETSLKCDSELPMAEWTLAQFIECSERSA